MDSRLSEKVDDPREIYFFFQRIYFVIRRFRLSFIRAIDIGGWPPTAPISMVRSIFNITSDYNYYVLSGPGNGRARLQFLPMVSPLRIKS